MPHTLTSSNKGSSVIGNILSYVLFSSLVLFSKYLEEVSSGWVLAVRIIFNAPVILIICVALVGYKPIIEHAKRVCSSFKLIMATILVVAIYALQMWLFVWSAPNGKGIALSIGYLIMPLILSVAGSLIFREKLTKLNILAVFIAAIGIITNLIITGEFTYYSILVFGIYPIAFLVRKHYNMDSLAAFTFEMILLLPLGVYFLSDFTFAFVNALPNPTLIYSSLLAVGICSGLAWSLFILSIRNLSFVTWNLLGYIEVILIFVISIYIGESIHDNNMILYGSYG